LVPDDRFIYCYKNAVSQGRRETREAKHTTEIIICDSSDLMSFIGNLEFGTLM